MRIIITFLAILIILSPLAISVATESYKIMIVHEATMYIYFWDLPIDLADGFHSFGDWQWQVFSMAITDPIY